MEKETISEETRFNPQKEKNRRKNRIQIISYIDIKGKVNEWIKITKEKVNTNEYW